MKTSNIFRLLALVALLAIMAACSSSSDDTGAEAVSGEVVDGLRVLTFEAEATEQEYRVYRGDYIRPEISSHEDFELAITALEVNQVFPAPKGQRDYFKVPEVGTYTFTIRTKGGVGGGTIEAINYSSASYTEVSAQEAATLIASLDPFILDVRTEGEFKSGHIEGATLIPVQVLQKRMGELADYREKPIFVYCRSGNRSTVAGKALIDAGFQQVINLRRGIAEWHRDGLPIVK